jgi:hypothetical protein
MDYDVSRHPGPPIGEMGSVSMIRGETEAGPNSINEIHISQQHLGKLDIRPYTFRHLARLKVIKMFHTSRNVGLHLSEESYVDATIYCLYMRSHVRYPGDPSTRDAEDERSLQSAWDLSLMASVRAPHLQPFCLHRSVIHDVVRNVVSCAM